MTKKTQIIIEVSGGVVQAVYADRPKWIAVRILDHDMDSPRLEPVRVHDIDDTTEAAIAEGGAA